MIKIPTTRFPNEVITLCLKYCNPRTLRMCSLVNSQFYQASIKYLWHSIHLKRQGKGISFLTRLAFITHPVGHHIRSVHLCGVRWTDRTLLGLMKRSPYLEAMVIDDGRQLTDASMQHVSHYWPHLKSLHLSASPITQVSYHVLGQQCPALVKLTLDRCPWLQQTTFVNQFSGLEDLVLTISDDDDAMDLSGLVHLTKLTIHGNPRGILQRTVTAAANGVSCWPRLTSITMDKCSNMTDDDVLPFLRLVPELTHVTLQRGDFSDTVLDAIGHNLPNLIALDMSHNHPFTPQGIQRLVQRCLQLQWLTLIITSKETNPHHHQHSSSSDNIRMTLHHLDSRALEILRHGPDTMLTWGLE
ncbi:unnamed protein product [Absidia cylindrospora]